ncbi:MAG: DNA pilot protein [Microviridae sp.]|nr:MAG: DNA pilot protein [Microviridae sp.]
MSTWQAVASMGSSFANLAGNIAGNKARKRESERTRAHDLNMWDKTNAYNHPSAQMERLRASGLNPNLVYGGSSGGTAGTANALPGAKDPKINDLQLGENPMMQYVTMKNTEAQTENVRSQQNLNEANTILTTNKAATELQNAINKGQDLVNNKQALENLKTVRDGYIQDNIFKTNKAKLSNEGRVGNEDVLEQEWNRIRLKNPNQAPEEILKQLTPRFLNMILDGSPLYNLLKL